MQTSAGVQRALGGSRAPAARKSSRPSTSSDSLAGRAGEAQCNLNDYRTQKKDPNKQIWLDIQATPEWQAGLSGHKIER